MALVERAMELCITENLPELTANASGGTCDNKGTCSGNTIFAEKGTVHVCRTSNGLCDEAEVCNGTTEDCPEENIFFRFSTWKYPGFDHGEHLT
jgi:hypothetical protein